MKYKYVKNYTKSEEMKPLTFGDLTNGDIFVKTEDIGEDCLDGGCYGTLYIKLKSERLINAVNLMDGDECYIPTNAEIKYYTGEIKINTDDFVEKVPVEDEN